MTKKTKKKQKRQRFINWLKSTLIAGISKGIEDTTKKIAISGLAALFLAISTFTITHKSNLFAGILNDFMKENFADIIAEANSEDYVEISGKTFKEPLILINKNLTIRGDERSVIIGDEKNNILHIGKNVEVSIENVNFVMGETAIFVDEGAKLVIKNCAFAENQIAIEAKNAASIYIENSFFEKSSDAAIHIAGISSAYLYKNTLSQNRVGIVAENSSIDISENIIKNSTDNAFYLFGDSSKIYKNVINRVFYGAGINFRKGIHKTEILDNTFASMKIGLYSISDAEIKEVSAKKNIFTKISENEILLTNTTPENFSDNQIDNLWSELDIENIGCNLEVCL